MNIIFRFAGNFALSALLILIFRALGWIQYVQPPELTGTEFLDDFLVAGIIALVLFVIGEIVGLIYRVVKTFFFFLGCFISIIYFFVAGYIKLAIAALVLDGWFDYSTELLVVILMTFLIGFVRIPQREEVDKEWEEFQDWKSNQETRQ